MLCLTKKIASNNKSQQATFIQFIKQKIYAVTSVSTGAKYYIASLASQPAMRLLAACTCMLAGVRFLSLFIIISSLWVINKERSSSGSQY